VSVSSISIFLRIFVLWTKWRSSIRKM
jgi:hypothetical protein